jgi:hypothetical protein
MEQMNAEKLSVDAGTKLGYDACQAASNSQVRATNDKLMMRTAAPKSI